jgi:nucleotide-binding universal stress UspA family protein
MRIVVGIDGSRTREQLRTLDRLLSLRGHELVLVYVHDTGVRGELEFLRERVLRRGLSEPDLARVGQAEAARAEAITKEAEAAARELEAQFRTVTEVGEPGRVLISIATDQQADLIVVAARSGDLSVPAGPKSLGHTARFVVDHSSCPVLLLRRS